MNTLTSPGPDGNAGNSNASYNQLAVEMWGLPKQTSHIISSIHNTVDPQ